MHTWDHSENCHAWLGLLLETGVSHQMSCFSDWKFIKKSFWLTNEVLLTVSVLRGFFPQDIWSYGCSFHSTIFCFIPIGQLRLLCAWRESQYLYLSPLTGCFWWIHLPWCPPGFSCRGNCSHWLKIFNWKNNFITSNRFQWLCIPSVVASFEF